MHITIEPLHAADADECERILRSLPQWFGVESAIREYRRDLDVEETYVARLEGEIAGFISIKPIDDAHLNIHVIAVRPQYHRRGIGRALVEHVQALAAARGVRELEVKTLSPARPDEFYARTRAFYAAMGFKPVEETTEIWGQANPCLILAKDL